MSVKIERDEDGKLFFKGSTELKIPTFRCIVCDEPVKAGPSVIVYDKAGTFVTFCVYHKECDAPHEILANKFIKKLQTSTFIPE